jgi:PAS domain S-box-containing protein
VAGQLDAGGGLHRLLVESVRDYAIFALDPDGRVLSWNAGARASRGYEPHEIIGRHFSAFYPPADIAAGKPDGSSRSRRATGASRTRGGACGATARSSGPTS